MSNGYTKSVPEVITELKEELKDFAATRLQMLRSELDEKLQSFKMAAPTIAIGVLILATAWLAFTGFLVCIIAEGFGPVAWNYTVSFLIVFAAYAIVGGAAAYLGWREIKKKGIKPERTVRVLQQDRIWLQTEGRTQL